MSNYLLIGLAVLVVVLIIILFLILFIIIYMQRIEEKKQRKIVQYIEKRKEDWYAYLVNGSIEANEVAPESVMEYPAIDEILYRYAWNFTSNDMRRRIIRYSNEYLDVYYKKQLASRNWSVRMNVLHTIHSYELSFLLEDVISMATGSKTYSKEEYILFYQIIGKLHPKHCVQYFTNPKIALGEFDYKKLLSDLEDEALAVFFKQFDILPDPLQWALLDIIGTRHLYSCLPLLERSLNSEMPEIRIRALKNIAALEVAVDEERYMSFTHSAIWEERLMAVKVFSNAPIKKAEKVLVHHLSDEVYAVRAQAARSLKEMKHGQKALQSVINFSDDTFAADIAAEMLRKE